VASEKPIMVNYITCFYVCSPPCKVAMDSRYMHENNIRENDNGKSMASYGFVCQIMLTQIVANTYLQSVSHIYI
jgi:hypothetical protein